MPKLTAERLNSRLEVHIHFRTLISTVTPDSDSSSINKKLKSLIRDSQDLFLLHEILILPQSYESLKMPELKVLDAAETGTSDEQKALIQEFTPPENEVAAYLVDTIMDANGNPIAGCALPDQGAIMIAKQ